MGNVARRTILVAEDDRDLRRFIEASLRLAGYRTRGAADGPAALALAFAHPPDCVLLDLDLPILDGHAVLAAFRADRRLAAVPVVIVSGLVAPSPLPGDVSFLPKPTSADALLQAVERALGQRPAL